MSTVSIHIEGHEDGSLDDPHDLSVIADFIASRLMAGETGGSFPSDILLPYVGWTEPDEVPEDDDRASWSVQYSRY